MAVRKETIKKQFTEALPAVLEPGEQVQAGAYTISGPNPLWSQGLLGLLAYFIFGMRYYYLAVTDRRVLFMKASMMSARPKGGLAFADPRSSVSISEIHTDAKLWNWCKYTGSTKQGLRLNFHAFWRDEMKALIGALADRTQGPATSTEAPPPPATIDPAPPAPPPPA